jgi:hypothetical protein
MDNILNNNEPVDYEIFFVAQAIQQSRLGFFISAHYSQLDHLFSLRFFRHLAGCRTEAHAHRCILSDRDFLSLAHLRKWCENNQIYNYVKKYLLLA